MPRSLKQGIIGASTTILSKNIDKYASMCGSNFNETDVTLKSGLTLTFRNLISSRKGCVLYTVQNYR